MTGIDNRILAILPSVRLAAHPVRSSFPERTGTKPWASAPFNAQLFGPTDRLRDDNMLIGTQIHRLGQGFAFEFMHHRRQPG